ncbi:MAG: hypothetical protein ACRDP1_10995 [Nocardioidaceae bacterium]
MAPTKKVFLHVGSPKTGTTLLQDLLFHNRHRLAEHGVLYAAKRFDQHFLAALDLMGMKWGGLEKDAAGAWSRLAAQAREFDGNVVISHEILAAANQEQAERALRDLDAEVHLVCSARDLARQIPAEWQESIKHRREFGYADFCADLQLAKPKLQASRWFWKVQSWPEVLARWGSTLPADRVHVVTVPAPDAPRSLLMERFVDTLEIKPGWLAERSQRSNAGLGGVEATVIKHVNQRLPPTRLEPHYYREIVRELLAHRTLAGHLAGGKVVLPPALYEWASALSQDWTEQLRAAKYDIVGELDDLLPAAPAGAWVDPDAATPLQQLEVTEAALDAVILELARSRRAEDEHRAAGSSAPSRSDRTEWVKRRLVEGAERNRGLAVAHRAYRRLRSR